MTPVQARCPSPAVDPAGNNNDHQETQSQEPELKTSSVGVVYFNQPSSLLSPAKECQPPFHLCLSITHIDFTLALHVCSVQSYCLKIRS